MDKPYQAYKMDTRPETMYIYICIYMSYKSVKEVNRKQLLYFEWHFKAFCALVRTRSYKSHYLAYVSDISSGILSGILSAISSEIHCG